MCIQRLQPCAILPRKDVVISSISVMKFCDLLTFVNIVQTTVEPNAYEYKHININIRLIQIK